MTQACNIFLILMAAAPLWSLDLSMLNTHFVEDANRYFVSEALCNWTVELVASVLETDEKESSFAFSPAYLMYLHVLILIADSDLRENLDCQNRNITLRLGNRHARFLGVLGIGGVDVIIDIGDDKVLRLPHMGQFLNALEQVPEDINAQINQFDPEVQEVCVYSAREYVKGYSDFFKVFSSESCRQFLPQIFEEQSLLPFFLVVEKLNIRRTLEQIVLSKNVWWWHSHFLRKDSPYRHAWIKFAMFLGQIGNNPDISLSNIALVVSDAKKVSFRIIDFHSGAKRKRKKSQRFCKSAIYHGWAVDILASNIKASKKAGAFALIYELSLCCDT